MMVALAFYIAFEEKLRVGESIGTFFVVSSAIIRGISMYASSTASTGSISGVIPILLAIL